MTASRWIIVGAAPNRGRNRMVFARCGGCGVEMAMYARRIELGRSRACRSCAAPRKHGHADSTTYVCWQAMHARCRNPKATGFANYGGRGIRVCERWASFENFLADMGERPSLDHSLDRFPDNNGNYEPGNCRWATRAEQQNNKRLSAPRVARILDEMKASSSDLLERAVLDRVRMQLLG